MLDASVIVQWMSLHAAVVAQWVYLALPIAACAVALRDSRRLHSANPIHRLIVTSVAGAVGGLGLIIIYIRSSDGRVPASQIAIACYWGIAVGQALRGFGALLVWAMQRLVPGSAGGREFGGGVAVAGSIFRAAMLVAATVSYVGAMALVYRPHAVYSGTPTSILGVSYHEVSFTATDGLHLRGWWIPAAHTADTDSAANLPADFGQRTVIFCHGFGADKAAQLRLVRDLVPNGYNVLAFDMRAHGESDGQLTTFGDLERRDVLGAVRWARETHPNESRKIFGLGESLGAAALIGAASDPSADGQAIEAIVVFAPYDRLATLVQGIADAHFVPAAGWIATHIALPLAGAQLGTPLADFSPDRDVEKIAPRPVLVIATEKDRDIDINRSHEVYEAACQPKYAYWIKKGGRRLMLFGNDDASMAVRVFFQMAREII